MGSQAGPFQNTHPLPPLCTLTKPRPVTVTTSVAESSFAKKTPMVVLDISEDLLPWGQMCLQGSEPATAQPAPQAAVCSSALTAWVYLFPWPKRRPRGPCQAPGVMALSADVGRCSQTLVFYPLLQAQSIWIPLVKHSEITQQ